MPRSFLVKKYFSYKKQNYRELDHAVVPVQRYPLAELPTQDNSSVLTCYPTTPSPTLLLSSGMDSLPGLLFPPLVEPVSPTTNTLLSPMGPVDLSSCSPFSSSASEEDEEDGGRSSDPPSPDALQQHVFDCLHCSKSYSSPAALANHQLSHASHHHSNHHHSHHSAQGEQETIAVSVPTSQVSQRPAFHCKHCPKEYTSLGALKMHIRSHTLPCVCLTCGKAFSRPWLLRGHIRTHTGERPFSCQHCNRAFADRSNLRAHLQTHSEVKKYQCGSCSRTFSRMSLLHKHSNSGCCPAS